MGEQETTTPTAQRERKPEVYRLDLLLAAFDAEAEKIEHDGVIRSCAVGSYHP